MDLNINQLTSISQFVRKVLKTYLGQTLMGLEAGLLAPALQFIKLVYHLTFVFKIDTVCRLLVRQNKLICLSEGLNLYEKDH